MAEWLSEASEYLDGYLKQVAVLVRQQGDDPEDVVAGLRDHIANEVESDGAATVTIERLLSVLGDLGSPEEVASFELGTLKPAPTSAKSISPPLPVPPIAPPTTKSVVVHRHRSPLTCLLTIILAPVALMVILAILGILVAILLPAFARSREGAGRAECQDNLKQIGIALMSYAEDNDGELPPLRVSGKAPVLDSRSIYPAYIEDAGVFACPSVDITKKDITAAAERNKHVEHNYIFFSHVVRHEQEAISYLDAVEASISHVETRVGEVLVVRQESEMLKENIVLSDGSVLPKIRLSDENSYDVPDSAIPLLVERTYYNHRQWGFNVLFLDGHVEFGEIIQGDWGPVGRDGFPWTGGIAERLDGIFSDRSNLVVEVQEESTPQKVD